MSSRLLIYRCLWAQAVGPQIAAVTTPARTSRGPGGNSLDVMVSTLDWASELSGMTSRIVERLRAVGYPDIDDIHWLIDGESFLFGLSDFKR
jgi:hypothetical protein